MIIVTLIFIGFIAFAIFLILFLRKDNTITLEEAKSLYKTENSHYFEFSKQQFHYVEKGKGETIVLLHGIGDSFIVFNEFGDLLAKKHQVISIDLPGFGLSEVPFYSKNNDSIIQYYRDFIDAFLKHKNISEFHLMGNSLGGLVSWDWAVNNKEYSLKSLTLIASAGFEMETVRKNVSKGILDKLPKFLLKKGAPLKVSELGAATCLVNKNKVNKQYIQAHSSMLNKQGTIEFFIKLLFNSFEPEVEKLNKLAVPTLIVWGEKDLIIPSRHADLFEAKITKSKKVLYKNCGHYPQIEFAEELAEDWKVFVEGL